MKQRIKLLVVVELTEDLPNRKLRRGQVGTMVELLDPGALEVDSNLTMNDKDLLNNNAIDSVWVSNGIKSNFPGGVFTSKELAEKWIEKHPLTGTFTRYPLDIVYEWALSNESFTPKKKNRKYKLPNLPWIPESRPLNFR